jgi:hypothetical protein
MKLLALPLHVSWAVPSSAMFRKKGKTRSGDVSLFFNPDPAHVLVRNPVALADAVLPFWKDAPASTAAIANASSYRSHA